MANQLPAIKHIVQLMLENRSFDQMLGFLYTANGNKSPTNQPFEGLTGNESNPDDAGREIRVFKIDGSAPQHLQRKRDRREVRDARTARDARRPRKRNDAKARKKVARKARRS